MKRQKAMPEQWAAAILAEAQKGNPDFLIGRVLHILGKARLSAGEVQFVVDALEATRKKYGKQKLNQSAQWLIAEHVISLENDSGMSRKQAVDAVMQDRGCSRVHIYRALKAHRLNPRGIN
jgi:hypothetical protein